MTRKQLLLNELRKVLETKWFTSDSEKDKSVELIKTIFPRANFCVKTDWRKVETETIDYQKITEIIKCHER